MYASQTQEYAPVEEDPDDFYRVHQPSADPMQRLLRLPLDNPFYLYENVDRYGRDRNLQDVDFDELYKDVLSDEEYAQWQAEKVRIAHEATKSGARGEAAYERAYRTETLHGRDAALGEYKRAARLLITANASDSALNTHGEIRPANPVRYFKIADALTKQAEAEGTDKEKLIDPAGNPTNRREYLGNLALAYFNRGIDILLIDGRVAGDFQMPDNPSNLVATAIAEAAQNVDNAHAHKVLAPEGEEQLALALQSGDPRAVKYRVTDLVEKDESGLEVIPRASQIINEELTGTHRFSLAA